MGRKFLLVLFIIALIFAGKGLWGRLRVEELNNRIELIMDYNALSLLQKETDKDLLVELKKRELTGVAVYPDTIRDLVNQGQARLLSGNEVNRTLDKTGTIDPLLNSFPYEDDSLFVKIKDPAVIRRAVTYLPEWKKKYQLDYKTRDDELVIFFKEWKIKFLHLSFGFDRDLIDRIKRTGLKVIPRVDNNPLNNQLNWDFLREMSPDYVIFSGKEITGYDLEPGRSQLAKTADIMRTNQISFGMIEPFIAKQLGAATLARKLDYKVLRVHSIQQGEMDSRLEKYSMERIVDRYLLAARERNVRLLYLKPFLQEKGGKEPVDLTLDYIRTLSSRLKEEGFIIGKARPYPQFSNTEVEVLFISLGIMIAGVLLLEYLSGIKLTKWALLIILLGLIGELGLFYLGKGMLVRKVLALASSVIFPSLAIITQIFSKNGDSWLWRFLKAGLISLLGAVFLSASLAHISFMLKVDQFTGVKLSFILPVILVTFYYFKELRFKREFNWRERITAFLNLNIKVKHLLLLFVLALGGAVYIGRTGNYPILPIPDVEVYIRDWLEKVLYVRPRFKEFLLGHPFLVVTLGLVNSLKNRLIFYPLLLLATIGQINILNTFSHAHTPLPVSLLRVFHGLWLGLIIGIILLVVLRYLIPLWSGRKAGTDG